MATVKTYLPAPVTQNMLGVFDGTIHEQSLSYTAKKIICDNNLNQ